MKSMLPLAAAVAVLLLAAPSWAQYSPLITAPMANNPVYGNDFGRGHGDRYGYGFGYGYGAVGTNGVGNNGGTSGTGSGGSTAGSVAH